MNRINIYSNNDDVIEQKYEGWFDLDASTEIGSIITSISGPYKHGKVLRATANSKLIINEWNNSGYDQYRFATDESEIAEILAGSNVNDFDSNLAEILDKYEL